MLINAPPVPLHNMVAPWPFSMWGMDVIGPIIPKASNGHRFILVAIDYFTKWVEAASYANVTFLTPNSNGKPENGYPIRDISTFKFHVCSLLHLECFLTGEC
jgi:hypothetical protein